MLTPKQRAFLRKTANSLDALYQMGKNGITPTLIQTLDDALTAKELIKISVLENCPQTAKEAMEILTEKLGCDGVHVIGRKVTLYRPNPEKPVIVLPK